MVVTIYYLELFQAIGQKKETNNLPGNFTDLRRQNSELIQVNVTRIYMKKIREKRGDQRKSYENWQKVLFEYLAEYWPVYTCKETIQGQGKNYQKGIC